MANPGIPDITITCIHCGRTAECVTTLVDVEHGPDGAPALLLLRVDTAPLLAHQRIHHPRSSSL
ncbi:MAG: hypothetical protein Q8M17_10625 [Actinomycetota bacterium]|nr:hypothetical protein [Actinomycetota bacterium]